MSDVKIYVLHCGTITLDEKVAFGTKHPQLMKVKAQLTPERKRITLPNCAYLVASKSGLVLIDTGWSRDISPNGVPDADAATDFTSAFIWNLYHGHVGPGQTAMEKLEAMGIRPEDLNCVLFTTLVAERCCAIRDFSERTRLIVAQEESFYSYRHGAFHATYLYSDLPELEQYYFVGTMEGPAWRSLDLFEDGTFAFHRDTDSRQTVNGPVRLLPEESEAFVLTEIDDFISLNGTAIGQWICPEDGPGTGALSHITAMYCSDQDSLLMFTDEGNVLAAQITGYGAEEEDPVSEMPDWSQWTHLEGFCAVWAPRGDGVEGPCWIVAGLEKDGTVLAWPVFTAEALAGWSDLKEVRLEHTYALGLKKDGTVVSAGFNGYPAPDVSSWTGIAAIRLFTDFCVGIREDGTLAFAGEHVFMREGHEKK